VKTKEIPLVFSCQSDELIGIVHQPENPLKIGVLIVVGGPQYRAGSHRQFILLARMLADNGVPVMRFDYRGMGDSEGVIRLFADVDDDIKSAVDTFYQHSPGLSGVAVWGLCDAATAAAFYAYQDERIKGLVLLNPWVFTEQGAAKTYLKHYYLQRLFNPNFWGKIVSFQFNYKQSFSSLIVLFGEMLRPSIKQDKPNQSDGVVLVDSALSLPIRVLECLQRFKYPVLFVLSGRDLTADEFRDVIKSDENWQSLVKSSAVSSVELADADHTFSSQQWRDEVAQTTLDWVRQLQ